MNEESVRSDDVTHGEIPSLRIGFTTERKTIELAINGYFSLFDHAGIALAKNVHATTTWHLHVEHLQPADYFYNILFGKFDTYEAADELCYQLLEKGVGAQIKSVGGEWPGDHPVLKSSCEYWVVVDQFLDMETAQEFARTNAREWPSEIFREKRKEPTVRLHIMDSEMELVCEAENGIHFVPKSPETTISMKNFQLADAQSDLLPTLVFTNRLEFRSTNAGHLCVVMEKDTEQVLYAMLFSMTFKQARPDFLQALAITLRSHLAAGLNCVRSGEVFDWSMNQYVAAFLGDKPVNELCSAALDKTRGLVLAHSDQLVKAEFTEACGGHTESMTDSLQSELFTRIDAENGEYRDNFGALYRQDAIQDWISAQPNVLCNPYKFNGLNPWGARFRWAVEYDRTSLEARLNEYANQDIGELFDILPVKRSGSGRILELEVLASYSNLYLRGDDEIRQALGFTSVHSTCFFIEREFDADFIPATFLLRGAGAGHGKGLCLAGAVELSNQERDYVAILKHYFANSELIKIY